MFRSTIRITSHHCMASLSDKDILALLQKDGDRAMEALFEQYYQYLCGVVYRIRPSASEVEDIVQDVFYEIWRKRERIQISTSIRAYLRRAAVNRTLNHIRDKRMDFDDEEKAAELDAHLPGAQQQMEASELQDIINAAIDRLPEKCRAVFAMSRFEEMTYQEIATALNISVKTVENQISKALKLLREAVAPYMTTT